MRGIEGDTGTHLGNALASSPQRVGTLPGFELAFALEPLEVVGAAVPHILVGKGLDGLRRGAWPRADGRVVQVGCVLFEDRELPVHPDIMVRIPDRGKRGG